MKQIGKWRIAPGFVMACIGAVAAMVALPEAPDAVAFRSLPPSDSADGVTYVQGTLPVPARTELASALADFALAPLFAENRSPAGARQEIEEPVALEPEIYEPQEPAIPAVDPLPPPELPSVLFLGFMRIGDYTRVLIRDGSTGIDRWMGSNDKIGSWTLVEMSHDAIIFQSDGTQKAIKRWLNPLP